MKWTVATRGSKLSLIQTSKFLAQLKQAQPDAEFELKIIKTLGDAERTKPLFCIDRKGIFEREIDQALVNGMADFAVASLKDVPTERIAETVVAAIPKRASPHDVLISRDKTLLKDLRKGAVIGTGSLRRLAQIKYIRPDLNVQPIRGNVDTRIKKVKKGDLEGVIVAEAGLERMELAHEITERFSLDEFPSAPGQGALAIVVKKGDQKTTELLQPMDDLATRAEVTAERSLMVALGGGCRVPLGSVGKAQGDTLTLRGVMFTLDGHSKIEAMARATVDEAEALGKRVAECLAEKGAKAIEAEWREKYGLW